MTGEIPSQFEPNEIIKSNISEKLESSIKEGSALLLPMAHQIREYSKQFEQLRNEASGQQGELLINEELLAQLQSVMERTRFEIDELQRNIGELAQNTKINNGVEQNI